MHHTFLTKYGVNKLLIFYREEGAEVALKELRQLHQKGAIYPNDPTKMTRKEIKYELRYLMFLKKKRCGHIKGNGCADGRKQRGYIKKEEVSYPIMSKAVLMLLYHGYSGGVGNIYGRYNGGFPSR